MASIPSSGSLVATHDYYRSEYHLLQIYTTTPYAMFTNNIASDDPLEF